MIINLTKISVRWKWKRHISTETQLLWCDRYFNWFIVVACSRNSIYQMFIDIGGQRLHMLCISHSYPFGKIQSMSINFPNICQTPNTRAVKYDLNPIEWWYLDNLHTIRQSYYLENVLTCFGTVITIPTLEKNKHDKISNHMVKKLIKIPTSPCTSWGKIVSRALMMVQNVCLQNVILSLISYKSTNLSCHVYTSSIVHLLNEFV